LQLSAINSGGFGDRIPSFPFLNNLVVLELVLPLARVALEVELVNFPTLLPKPNMTFPGQGALAMGTFCCLVLEKQFIRASPTPQAAKEQLLRRFEAQTNGRKLSSGVMDSHLDQAISIRKLGSPTWVTILAASAAIS
jgi:hypothetical protein